MKPTRMLVLGDPHASPDYDNSRFRRAGELARRFKVDRVLCTGDWTDFASLLDHGTAESQEGLLYQADVEAATEALEFFTKGLRGYQTQLDITLGNHDERPDRFVAKNPRFKGKMSWRDVPYEEHGWRVTRWKKVIKIGPFTCTHHFCNKRGFAVASERLAQVIVTKKGALGNAIVGHDHRWILHEEEAQSGRKVMGLVAGTLAHPRMAEEEWCAPTSHEWKIRPTIVEWDEKGVVRGLRWEDWT